MLVRNITRGSEQTSVKQVLELNPFLYSASLRQQDRLHSS